MNTSELHKLFVQGDGICTDTRALQSNTLFFALRGENFNGNNFAAAALEAGCNYAIIDEEQNAVSDKCIVVDSVLQTLQDLANYHRKQFDIPVLCITGSNGKTTCKELIGAVLEKKFDLLMTKGNLNNHLGVPFTLLGLNSSHEFALIETGANKPGDIKELVEIAEPTYGVITNIGAAHIEGFGSLEGVEKTKTEMYDFVSAKEGVIFYNSSDPTLLRNLPNNTTNIAYGTESGDVIGDLVALDPFVKFKWRKDEYLSEVVTTNLVGKYNLLNFLTATTIGDYFGVSSNDINDALTNYKPSNNRSQVTKTATNTLIVDCYNANATSMKAALESFSEMEGQSKLAILGDMLELGHISTEEHQKIADQAKELGIDSWLVGAEFGKVNSTFRKFAGVNEVIEELNAVEQSQKLILLKGSRGIRLEKSIEHL
ncbi:MAG: hypothetical protein BM555_06560 [Crocinitomix sp. MedPE-SWsnd]|nr:MAG: hypothetical protein BM555_06560 [Crocinitomix sp. MedPE-SWsnd]